MNERIVMLLCSSAMTTPTCPCCGNSSVTQWPSDDYEYECDNCACLWDESVRRAQTAEGVDDLDAGDNFRRSVLSKADAHDPYPLWHGWVIMDAFLAGAAYARRAQPAELSTDDYMRLVEWMRSKPRRRANTAFTAGMLRSIAYAVEHAEQPAEGMDKHESPISADATKKQIHLDVYQRDSSRNRKHEM